MLVQQYREKQRKVQLRRPPPHPAQQETKKAQPSGSGSVASGSGSGSGSASSSVALGPSTSALAPAINLTSSNGSATRALRPAATLPHIPTPKTPVSGAAGGHTIATMQNLAITPGMLVSTGPSGGVSGLVAGMTGNKGFIHHEPSTGKRTRSPLYEMDRTRGCNVGDGEFHRWITSGWRLTGYQAVAKHGQKWDLVQKELPNRGYHQVRQRWLRKQGKLKSRTHTR